MDLGVTRQTGADVVAMSLLLAVEGEVLDQQGSGPHDGHIPRQDIQKLG